MITLTEQAEIYFEKLCQPPQKIVFGTKNAGCSGLSYQLEIVDVVKEVQYVKLNTKYAFEFFIEKKSLPYLEGLIIDLQKEGLQSRIVYKNPNEIGQCGCGESFAVGSNEN